MNGRCRGRRRTLRRLRLHSRCRCLRRCLSTSWTSRGYTRCGLSYRLYPAQRRRPSTRGYSYITRSTSTHLATWLGAVISMKLRSIRGDPILGRHLRLLLLLLRLLLLLLMVLVLMMMVVQVMADVDRELGRMGQLVEVGRRRRRRLRLMAGMHMVIVASRLRILAGMRGREVRMLRTATVRQETVHGS